VIIKLLKALMKDKLIIRLWLLPEEIEDLKKKGIHYINWNGWYMAAGPGCTSYFYDEISHRLKHNKSVVVIFTGPPGSGKSYMALRLAQIFDRKFNPDKQVCFSRLELYEILSGETKLKRGQIIILDESHISIGARTFQVAEQRSLVNLLAAARSKGYGIFIITLHQAMVDTIVRNYMSVFLIAMNEPGYGDLYHLYTPRFEKRQWRKKLPPIRAELPDAEICDYPDCLSCKYKDCCMTIRARYERKKDKYLTSLAKEAAEKKHKQIEKKHKPTQAERISWILEDYDKIRFGPRGGVVITSIQAIYRKHKCEVGLTQAREDWVQAKNENPWLAELRKNKGRR